MFKFKFPPFFTSATMIALAMGSHAGMAQDSEAGLIANLETQPVNLEVITDFPGIPPSQTQLQANENIAIVTEPEWGQVSGNYVNVRCGPGTDHLIIVTLRGGDFIHVTSQRGKWLEIKWPKDAPAWISQRFVNSSGAVTGDRVRIRARGSLGAPILKLARKGDLVDVLGAVGDWYKIRAPKGAKAFISKKYTILGVPPPAGVGVPTDQSAIVVNNTSTITPVNSIQQVSEPIRQPINRVPVIATNDDAEYAIPQEISEAIGSADRVLNNTQREVETLPTQNVVVPDSPSIESMKIQTPDSEPLWNTRLVQEFEGTVQAAEPELVNVPEPKSNLEAMMPREILKEPSTPLEDIQDGAVQGEENLDSSSNVIHESTLQFSPRARIRPRETKVIALMPPTPPAKILPNVSTLWTDLEAIQEYERPLPSKEQELVNVPDQKVTATESKLLEGIKEPAGTFDALQEEYPSLPDSMETIQDQLQKRPTHTMDAYARAPKEASANPLVAENNETKALSQVPPTPPVWDKNEFGEILPPPKDVNTTWPVGTKHALGGPRKISSIELEFKKGKLNTDN